MLFLDLQWRNMAVNYYYISADDKLWFLHSQTIIPMLCFFDISANEMVLNSKNFNVLNYSFCKTLAVFIS